MTDRYCKTVAIFDANFHGHHPTYLKIVTKLLLENGCKVWLFCQQSYDVMEWIKYNTKDLVSQYLEIFPVAPMLSKNLFTWPFWSIHNWINAERHLKHAENAKGHQPDIVLFLKVDDLTKGFLRTSLVEYLFKYPWVGIYIHLKIPVNKSRLILNWIFKPFSIFSSKYCKAIGTLQEDAIDYLKNFIDKPIVLFPDMTDESPPFETGLIQNILAKAGGRKIIGLLGGHDRRKGSFKLFEIAKLCKDSHKDWFFLFIGKMNYYKSDQELKLLEKLIGERTEYQNCFFHFERITDEGEFNALINLCDVAFAVYDNFPYSSNIMTKTAIYRVPLVVASGYLMEKRIIKYGTGIASDGGGANECIRAISTVLESKFPDLNFINYHSMHSQSIFNESLKNLISGSTY